MTFKTEMIDFIDELAKDAGNRKRFVVDLHSNVGNMLKGFENDLKEIATKHVEDGKNLHRFLATVEKDRLEEAMQFQNTLVDEANMRIKEADERVESVKTKLGEFTKDLAAVAKELLSNAIELRSNLCAGEAVRLTTAHNFCNTLSKENKGRVKEAHTRSCNTKSLLRGFTTSLMAQRKQMDNTFAEARQERDQQKQDREEIRSAWNAMSETAKTEAPDQAEEPVKKTQQPKQAVQTKEPEVLANNDYTPDSNSSEPVEEGLNTKILAIIAAFGIEGCRFSDIYRSSANVTKGQLRDILVTLMDGKEIRRDEDNRYFIV